MSYESAIDRAIRLAQERGDFDDLPGMGKPLPGAGQDYHEDWWLKEMIARENLSGMLPPSLALRKEIDELETRLAKITREQVVRDYLADLNKRIVKANRGLLDGPPVALQIIDVDGLIENWRSSRPPN